MKPFDLEELRLRIENIMRRHGNVISQSSMYQISDIRIDTKVKQVRRDTLLVELSPKEYALLELLLENRGNILTREYLYEMIW